MDRRKTWGAGPCERFLGDGGHVPVIGWEIRSLPEAARAAFRDNLAASGLLATGMIGAGKGGGFWGLTPEPVFGAAMDALSRALGIAAPSCHLRMRTRLHLATRSGLRPGQGADHFTLVIGPRGHARICDPRPGEDPAQAMMRAYRTALGPERGADAVRRMLDAADPLRGIDWPAGWPLRVSDRPEPRPPSLDAERKPITCSGNVLEAWRKKKAGKKAG